MITIPMWKYAQVILIQFYFYLLILMCNAVSYTHTMLLIVTHKYDEITFILLLYYP